MPEAASAVNAYQCAKCGYLLVTINRVEGTTPFMIDCKNPAMIDGCPGPMRSHGYRLPPGAPEPTWEWYSPSKSARKRLDAWSKDHVERGGLLLRKIEP